MEQLKYHAGMTLITSRALTSCNVCEWSLSKRVVGDLTRSIQRVGSKSRGLILVKKASNANYWPWITSHCRKSRKQCLDRNSHLLNEATWYECKKEFPRIRNRHADSTRCAHIVHKCQHRHLFSWLIAAATIQIVLIGPRRVKHVVSCVMNPFESSRGCEKSVQAFANLAT